MIYGGDDDEGKKHLQELLNELTSEKFDPVYLNKIHLKAFSNFMLAQNTEALSSYYSYPIQVMGDIFDIKLDITPKTNESNDKESKLDSTKKATGSATISNNSPITINVNLDEKKAEVKSDETKKDQSKDETSRKVNFIDPDELKILSSMSVKEVHLHYRYRVNNTFYGFSTGFFIDWLSDDNYVNKRTNPNDSIAEYKVVKENNLSHNKYGIMASVNVGGYFKKSDFFYQVFTGPGISIEQKPQPRLLFGVGLGKGSGNKISINWGMAIGQVQKLSSSIDLSQTYNKEQTNLYYKSLQLKGFVAISYIFDFRRKE
jgi:hypothetical protein